MPSLCTGPLTVDHSLHFPDVVPALSRLAHLEIARQAWLPLWKAFCADSWCISAAAPNLKSKYMKYNTVSVESMLISQNNYWSEGEAQFQCACSWWEMTSGKLWWHFDISHVRQHVCRTCRLNMEVTGFMAQSSRRLPETCCLRLTDRENVKMTKTRRRRRRSIIVNLTLYTALYQILGILVGCTCTNRPLGGDNKVFRTTCHWPVQAVF